jgi:hypothetical protein
LKATTDINITTNIITDKMPTMPPNQMLVKEITKLRKIRLKQSQHYQFATDPMELSASTA